ncbi:MAG: hypothetical protein JST31_10995 [Actinobacteria bacterium]|nr:hypothetical protein [Actinomycetota bacterium]
MATMMAREAWTDERLDDLNKRVDDGFTEMRQEFRAIRAETKAEFQAIRGETNQHFAETNEVIAALHRLTVQMFASMTLGFLGIIVTILARG